MAGGTAPIGDPVVVAKRRAGSVRPNMRNLFRLRTWWCIGALLVGAVLAHAQAPRLKTTPFKFAPLGVANPCFVDSVHFADTYLGGKKSGGARWVRVLRWGTVADDDSVGPGHAVAVFEWRKRLYVFDINFGVRELPVAVGRREDIFDLTAPVFSLYPQFKPIGAAVLDDSWTNRKSALRGADDGPVTPGYRDAYRAAKTLAKWREVRLVRFSYLEKGKRRESAAAVFLFDRKLCVYVPERGTVVQKQALPSIEDDAQIRARLERCFGPEGQVQVETVPPSAKGTAASTSRAPGKMKPAPDAKAK